MKLIKIGTIALLVALVAGTALAQWDWIDPSRGRDGYRKDNVVVVFVDDEVSVLDREDGVWVRRLVDIRFQGVDAQAILYCEPDVAQICHQADARTAAILKRWKFLLPAGDRFQVQSRRLKLKN